MEKTDKSNLALSVAILIIGITGLLVMVWLSPAPNDGPSGIPGVSATQEQAPASTDHRLGSTPNAADPFAEKLGAPDAVDTAKRAETPLASRENSIPPGVDPFKEKLLQQSKQLTSSPFGQPVTPPK